MLTVNQKKARFFKEIFNDALKTVIQPSTPHFSFRSYNDLPGYGLTGFGHEASALLLVSCIEGLPEEPHGDKLEELVLRALIASKIRDKASQEGFLEILAEFIQDFTNTAPKPFHCMFFLQVNAIPEWLLEKPILGYKIKLAPKVAWRAAATKLDRIYDLTEIKEIDIVQMIAVEIRVLAKDSQAAIAAAAKVSGIIRGSYHASQGDTWTMTGRAGPSSKFGPSPLFLVREGRKHIEWAYTPQFDPTSLTLPDQCPRRMALLLDCLSKEPKRHTPREVLAEALEVFAASGDEYRVQHEFLGLWQTLEKLSLADGGDTNRVATNIGNLWRNGSETIRYQLLAIAPMRNKLVHLGAYDVEQQSVTFLLIRIVRNTLIQFAQLTAKLKTKQHFLDVFSMMTLSPRALKTKSESTRVVRWMRGLS